MATRNRTVYTGHETASSAYHVTALGHLVRAGGHAGSDATAGVVTGLRVRGSCRCATTALWSSLVRCSLCGGDYLRATTKHTHTATEIFASRCHKIRKIKV